MKNSLAVLVFALLCAGCNRPSFTGLPKTLLFSPISPEYLRDTAPEWKGTGFDGFLLSGIMASWQDDIWATDGDPTTRDERDGTLQRVLQCNRACADAGIVDNFIKVAFYKHVPDWTDDTAWKKVVDNFREAARFARMSQCRGIALDIEYVAEQYDLEWEGYDYSRYSRAELRRAAANRGEQLVGAMIAEFPDMVFLHLPEGLTFYGPLAGDFFAGLVAGLAELDAPGGLHLLTERSYSVTSTLGIIHYAFDLERKVLGLLPSKSAAYWKARCSIAPGGWPLGYYRKITDEQGHFLGWSGRENLFGDSLVGSYADKSQRFTPREFRDQYAGLLLAGKQYCWIYGHGATWWQFDEQQVKKYGNLSNSALPVDPELDQFKQVLQKKWRSSGEYRQLARLYKAFKADEFFNRLGLVRAFRISGPFGCRECGNFDKAFEPEEAYLNDPGNFAGITVRSDSLSGYLDFTRYFKPKDWVCAYAWFVVDARENKAAQIRLGSNDSALLWLNGKPVLRKNVERSAALDDDIISVNLKEGANYFLAKVCNTEGQWGLIVRLTDERGRPFGSSGF